jgi:putative membrane protein
MILPGISGSFILLILGKYQYIMGTITSCVGNVGALWGAEGADKVLFWNSTATLAIFLIGAVVGILSFSKFLHWLLARWHKETLIVLAGFIIGSLVKVWPWSNEEALMQDELHIAGAIIFAVIGFSLVTGIELAGKLVKK